ncbi:MAG: putative transcriptional regulator of sulfate adenylyltransferase, Rrf2 [Acidimicrobiales bacterium]|nr:putative transcriptional regulator of sulfate adenylyltransferase, Rrf2 [Acidimicrobiales bacterium]
MGMTRPHRPGSATSRLQFVRVPIAVEYGLCSLVTLAGARPAAPPMKLSEIIEPWMSERLLGSVLTQLAREGLVCSRRGPGGGFWLGREADQITVREVYQAVDQWPSPYAGPRPLTDVVWAQIEADICAALAARTLASLAEAATSYPVMELDGGQDRDIPVVG